MQARRQFIKNIGVAGMGSGLLSSSFLQKMTSPNTRRKDLLLGIVGLSPHAAAFSTLLNDKEKGQDLAGCRIVKLFHPPGNPDVEFTPEQLSSYQTEVEKAGVKSFLLWRKCWKMWMVC